MPTVLYTLALSMAFIHKFYVSNTQVHWNAQSQSLEITIRIFTDDLEKALSPHSPIYLGQQNEKQEAQTLLEAYLKKNFVLIIDTHAAPLSLLGREVENDLTYCYLEMPFDGRFARMEIVNTLLIETYREQKNLVDVEIGDWHQSDFFTASRYRATYSR